MAFAIFFECIFSSAGGRTLGRRQSDARQIVIERPNKRQGVGTNNFHINRLFLPQGIKDARNERGNGRFVFGLLPVIEPSIV